jgi:glycyl-tRNA synthetase beta chain
MTTFLLEIGTEELPADFVDSAIQQLQTLVNQSLEDNFINPEAIAVYGTPRRLAVVITGLPAQQGDREEEIKGPSAQAAFKDGQPTPAAIGFAKKQEVALDSLEIKETDKGLFVFIQKKISGLPTSDILQELVPQWIGKLEGRRFMRWGDGDLRFPRPIRWLVSLIDDDILPLEISNGSTTLTSGNISCGHRILHPEPVVINHAGGYLETLRQAYIEPDQNQRQEIIVNQIKAIGEKLDATAEIDEDLLQEVANLVEYPTAVLGEFDSEFLKLPGEVITTVMVTHQRYFPLRNANNELLANFITIGNGDPSKSDLIATGNARVIRARLADAQFFYQADCDQHLQDYLPELENVTFQEELGTIKDKVDRLMEITQQICTQLQLNEITQQEIESAAMLCKADLVTQMVYEFPELQGIMGEKYALVSGESPNVAQAIFEHYLPRGANDAMPESLAGQIVGISDRLDTLISIFGIGMLPTGSSDPFALRRAANAIVNVTWYGNLKLNLKELLEQGANEFVTAHPDRESPLNNLTDFFAQRLRTLLQDELHIDYDLVNAILGENDHEYQDRALTNLLEVRDRGQYLQSIRNNGTLANIYETINRAARLAIKGDLDTSILDPQTVIKPELLEKNSEKELYEAIAKLLPHTENAKNSNNYQLLINSLTQIAPILTNFFDGEDSVLVMADNLQVRQNRLNLLGLLRNHARVLADFGAIVKI